MKRDASFFLRILSVTAVICFFCRPFCLPAAEEHPSETLYQGKITIGLVQWPGFLPLYVAQEKGYFKEAGLDVELNTYASLAELSKNNLAGKMQARANLTLDMINENLKGLDHRAVLAIDYSNGADAILARSGVLSVKDFKGRRVGFEAGTLEEFFLSFALSENGLDLSDIVPVEGKAEETPDMLKAGKIDVAVSYQPFISKLILSSQEFHVVYSSTNAAGFICDVLTFRSEFIDSYPETIRRLIQAYFKAIDFWKEHPGEADAIAAKWLGDTPDSIAHQLTGIKIMDLQDNKASFTFSTGIDSLYGNLRQIARFSRKNGAPARSIAATDKLVEKKFIKEMNV